MKMILLTLYDYIQIIHYLFIFLTILMNWDIYVLSSTHHTLLNKNGLISDSFIVNAKIWIISINCNMEKKPSMKMCIYLRCI